ncbi:MAG: hypothetical protein WC505_07690 [Patescibacteria group bacterium]
MAGPVIVPLRQDADTAQALIERAKTIPGCEVVRLGSHYSLRLNLESAEQVEHYLGVLKNA